MQHLAGDICFIGVCGGVFCLGASSLLRPRIICFQNMNLLTEMLSENGQYRIILVFYLITVKMLKNNRNIKIMDMPEEPTP